MTHESVSAGNCCQTAWNKILCSSQGKHNLTVGDVTLFEDETEDFNPILLPLSSAMIFRDSSACLSDKASLKLTGDGSSNKSVV